jgi:hypothetical protein
LPYGTSYWHVVDSTEQNGCFKITLLKAKQALVAKKNDYGLKFTIDKRDAVKLVKEAWAVSFARVITNRRAVLHIGWRPKALNFNVLLNSKILPSKPKDGNAPDKSLSTSSKIDPSCLNLSEGLAGTLIEQIVMPDNKEAKTNGTNLAEITDMCHATAKNQLSNHKRRCTAGLIASVRKFNLDSELLECVRHSAEMEKAKLHEWELKINDEYNSLLVQVQGIKDKNLTLKNGEVHSCTE